MSQEPDSREAKRQLAGAYLSAGQLDRAQRHHEQLLEQLPDDVDLMNNAAWIYQRRGDPRALDTARRAFQLAPDRVDVLDTYGSVLLEAGRPDEALKVLRKAQVRAADNPWVRYHTALALAELGRDGEARELLAALLSSDTSFEKRTEARALLDRLSKG